MKKSESRVRKLKKKKRGQQKTIQELTENYAKTLKQFKTETNELIADSVRKINEETSRSKSIRFFTESLLAFCKKIESRDPEIRGSLVFRESKQSQTENINENNFPKKEEDDEVKIEKRVKMRILIGKKKNDFSLGESEEASYEYLDKGKFPLENDSMSEKGSEFEESEGKKKKKKNKKRDQPPVNLIENRVMKISKLQVLGAHEEGNARLMSRIPQKREPFPSEREMVKKRKDFL